VTLEDKVHAFRPRLFRRAHVSQSETLYPGELLGSGTVGRIGNTKALLRPIRAIRSSPVGTKGIRSSSIPVGGLSRDAIFRYRIQVPGDPDSRSLGHVEMSPFDLPGLLKDGIRPVLPLQ